MPTQTNFTGGSGRGLDWGTFLEGLRDGRPASYVLLLGLLGVACLALQAGGRTRGKGSRR